MTPNAIRLAIKSSKEIFSTNKVKIEEETTSTPTFFLWVVVVLTILSTTVR